MEYKTLVCDGNWNLKRNFKAIEALDSYKSNCGGVLGFLHSLQVAVKNVMPDRVIIMWDGWKSGKYRYDIYKPYKANRNKKWDEVSRVINKKILSSEDQEEYDFWVQKVKIQSILEELFIRQMEVDFIEGDDLIGQYVLESNARDDGEKVIIFSRDGDFKHLIDDNVTILRTDKYNQQEFVTKSNYKSKIGNIVENELLFKCFEGDRSDGITGVNGIRRNTLLKFFPDIYDVKYTYQELVDKSEELLSNKKKSKTLEKIINSREILYRNAKLMNLKKPFMTPESIEELKAMSTDPLSFSDRSIEKVLLTLTKDGYTQLLQYKGVDIDTFFSYFYGLMAKEKEYCENYSK